MQGMVDGEYWFDVQVPISADNVSSYCGADVFSVENKTMNSFNSGTMWGNAAINALFRFGWN